MLLPWAATRRGLADALGEIDGALPGSVVVRRMRCGKPPAPAGPTPTPATVGPHIQWIRTINDKRVTPYLNQHQRDRFQTWFDNARRLKELVAKLEIAPVHAAEIVEG